MVTVGSNTSSSKSELKIELDNLKGAVFGERDENENIEVRKARSRIIEKKGKWTELYDVQKKTFWYICKDLASYSEGHVEASKETEELVSDVEPNDFCSSLTCFLPIANTEYQEKTGFLLPEAKCCRQSFETRDELNCHRLSCYEHVWICVCCHQENHGLCYPRCTLCNNHFDANGCDLVESYEREVQYCKERLNGVKSNIISHHSERQKNVLDLETLKIQDVYPKRSGWGKITHTSGVEVNGYHKDNKLHGMGIIRWGDRSAFVGEFQDGKRQGLGTWKERNGRYYCGKWKGGLRDGYGFARGRDSSSYVGKWKDGKPSQIGDITLNDKYNVTGRFDADGKLEGTMVVKNGKGSKFVGTFQSKGENRVDKVTPCILNYDNGESYRGYMKNNERDGFGICSSSSGKTFVGRYERGIPVSGVIHRDRKGSFSFKDSVYIHSYKDNRLGFNFNEKLKLCTFRFGDKISKYRGDWIYTGRNGKGVHIWPNGTRYDGSFRYNQLHGEGCLVSGRMTYRGTFHKNTRHGQGEQTFSNGSIYQGQFQFGYISGKGIIKFPCGSYYVGSFRKNKMHGFGKLTFYFDGSMNKLTYQGMWSDGLQHGEGVLISFLGFKYNGMWSNGLRHGQGILEHQNGSKYEGMWSNGLRHGKGTYRYPCKSKIESYCGDWKYGMKSGVGSQEWRDGRRYEGHFFENRFHGFGRLYYQDGTSFQGDFCSGEKVGTGIVLWPDGSSFEGKWINGRGNTKGIYTMTSHINVSNRSKTEPCSFGKVLKFRVYDF